MFVSHSYSTQCILEITSCLLKYFCLYCWNIKTLLKITMTPLLHVKKNQIVVRIGLFKITAFGRHALKTLSMCNHSLSIFSFAIYLSKTVTWPVQFSTSIVGWLYAPILSFTSSILCISGKLVDTRSDSDFDVITYRWHCVILKGR